MISDKLLLWVTFVLVGAATFLPRSSFIVAGHRLQLPPKLQQALRYAPAAALAALVTPDVLTVEGSFHALNPKFFAAVAAVGTILFFRNPWLPFISGMGILAAARWL
ncbi:AzlD domain-containing protein [Pseudogulbenkiania sp. MAI-1]|uniref:AzlD domain-containing protein n=1 Tax=Pseudogulbenkiania sp. MAI-1 TaxID=990370 RepID=UPI0018DBACED|nr:AzlD domain-containing protein [Pseudogulbenkiania sp. MAI-1]